MTLNPLLRLVISRKVMLSINEVGLSFIEIKFNKGSSLG